MPLDTTGTINQSHTSSNDGRVAAGMSLLKDRVPAECDKFRSAALVALDAGIRTQWREPDPTVADTTHRITAELDLATATPAGACQVP